MSAKPPVKPLAIALLPTPNTTVSSVTKTCTNAHKFRINCDVQHKCRIKSDSNIQIEWQQYVHSEAISTYSFE